MMQGVFLLQLKDMWTSIGSMGHKGTSKKLHNLQCYYWRLKFKLWCHIALFILLALLWFGKNAYGVSTSFKLPKWNLWSFQSTDVLSKDKSQWENELSCKENCHRIKVPTQEVIIHRLVSTWLIAKGYQLKLGVVLTL